MPLRTDFTFSQKAWPGVGDIDDCWVLASLQSVHAIAPWLQLVDTPTFRAAAGQADTPAFQGGTIANAEAGIEGCFPSIAKLIEAYPDTANLSWAGFLAKAQQSRRVVMLFVKSSYLPVVCQFGWTGLHAVSVQFVGLNWAFINPLAPPHSKSQTIAESALKAAAEAFNPDHSISCIIMPTEADAFKTHPLYGSAYAAGYAAEKAKATSAVQAT